MPKQSDKGEVPPTNFAPTVPDASAASPFVFTQLMELSAAFARVEQKVDSLKETVTTLDGSVDSLKQTVSMARGVLIVSGIVFTVGLAIIGWMVAGDVRISFGEKPPEVSAATQANENSAAPAAGSDTDKQD